MKVTGITVTYGGKIPTVQYGSTDVHITHQVELQDGDDPVQATKDALAAVKQAVIDEVERLPSTGGNAWLVSVRGVKRLPE